MNKYLHVKYRETKDKFEKLSSRLYKSQEKGEFYSLSKRKQNFLISRVKKLWEKLRILEIQLKITTVGASLALLLMVSNASAQSFEAAPEKNPLPPPSVFGLGPYLVDIDNDGDLDLVASKDYEQLNVFMNKGTASVPAFEALAPSEEPFRNVSEDAGFSVWDIMGAGDLDGDGDIDFLSDDGYIIENTGSNAAPLYTEVVFEADLPYHGRLGDIDNDGDLDMVNLSYNGEVRVFQNTGGIENFVISETADLFGIALWDESINYVNDIQLIDMDGDDDLDLLLRVEYHIEDTWVNENKIVENTGSQETPVFTFHTDDNNPYVDLDLEESPLGDLDDDGDLDAVAFSYMGGLTYLEQDAGVLTENKEFIPEFYDGIVLPLSYYMTPQFVDFDGDGDLDLFTGSYEYDGDYYGFFKIRFYENKNTGTKVKFELNESPLPFVDEELMVQVPFFVDMDSDGDIDLIRVSYDYYAYEIQYVYMENTGSDSNPVYETSLLSGFSDFDGLVILSFVDIDDDGDMDIFAMTDVPDGEYSSTHAAVYLENIGSDPLTFELQQDVDNPLSNLNENNYPEMMEGYRLAFGDVDLDGDYDVAFTNYYGTILYMENTGSKSEPQFTDKTETGPFASISAGYYGLINLVDFDGDGDIDLFAHKLLGMVNEYYENTDIVGIHDLNASPGKLELFPNPVQDDIRLRIPEGVSGLVEYEVIGLDGKSVLKGELYIHGGDSPGISLDGQPSGMYFMKIRSGGKLFTGKFVKQ